MLLVLTGIAAVSGFSLGFLHELTRERIELQVLENKKLPAVKNVLSEALSDVLLAERTEFAPEEGDGKLLFPGRRDGEGTPYAVAFEAVAKGYGGDLTLMLGVDLATDTLTGVAVATHSETPGVGSRAAEPGFTDQFKGLGEGAVFKVKKDGGALDAVSGATVTSRAASLAAEEGFAWYLAHKAELAKRLEEARAEQAAAGEGTK